MSELSWKSHEYRLGGRSEASWTFIMLVGLALLLAARLLALRLNGTDLFFDEAQYWTWSLEPALGYYSKPPLIAWIIRAATDQCGAAEYCVRLPSPILHTATALAVFVLGRMLYDGRIGALAALAYATLPGVTVSAGIISTDVPLLFCWALALIGFVGLVETGAMWPALLLGVALGAGLNAKYAMAWFVLSMLVYLVATPSRRGLFADKRLYIALAVAAAMIAPNIAWNQANTFVTFGHTADNAKWTGSLLHPDKGLEFLGSQLGVFGPILFIGLLAVTWTAWREGLPGPDRLLLTFALPVLAAITVQGFLSRAHANWAAVSYVSGTLLVVATMVRSADWRWLRASFVLHAAVLTIVIAATTWAGRAALPWGPDPMARTLGWRGIADATRAELETARKAGKPYRAVVTDERSLTAELLYYLRDTVGPEEIKVMAWHPQGSRPHDHYEWTRPFWSKTAKEPVLLVSFKGDKSHIPSEFKSQRLVAAKDIPAGLKETRRVSFYALSGYNGP